MNKQDYPLNSLEGFLVNRRRFLITSGIGAVGLTLFPLTSAEASPVFGAVARFARAVGSSVVADLITDYVRQTFISRPTAQEVQRTNTAMANMPSGRFSDLSNSTVYSHTTERSYFFYPARSTDGFNACVAFFDRNRNQGSQRVTLIEGPSLFGIGQLAHRVAQDQDADTTRRVLLPRNGQSIANVRLDRSSNEPDIYQTEAGRVESVYRTNGNGRGEVRVEARNEGGTLLAGGTYDLTYTT